MFFFLEIRMKLYKTEENKSVATALNNMGIIYYKKGQHKKALEIYERVQGKEHLSVIYF